MTPVLLCRRRNAHVDGTHGRGSRWRLAPFSLFDVKLTGFDPWFVPFSQQQRAFALETSWKNALKDEQNNIVTIFQSISRQIQTQRDDAQGRDKHGQKMKASLCRNKRIRSLDMAAELALTEKVSISVHFSVSTSAFIEPYHCVKRLLFRESHFPHLIDCLKTCLRNVYFLTQGHI